MAKAIELHAALYQLDQWRAIARNLAQVLVGAAEYAEENGDDVLGDALRAAYESQCRAHGVEP